MSRRRKPLPTCSNGPKIAYRSRRKALKGRWGVGKKYAYRCCFCGLWHTSSEPPRNPASKDRAA